MCQKEIEVPDDKQYIKYCAECYRKKKEEMKDPYEAGKDDGRLSPVEFGQIYNKSVEMAIHTDQIDINENFNKLKEVFLMLKKAHQR